MDLPPQRGTPQQKMYRQLRKKRKTNERRRENLQRGPEEIAGEDHQRPTDTGKANPEGDLAAVWPGRILKLRKAPYDECTEPSQRVCICATGHACFHLTR